MGFRIYILLIVLVLVSTGVGYGQTEVSRSLEKAEQTISKTTSQNNSKKIAQEQGKTLTKKEQRQLSNRQKSQSTELEGDKVKSVPISSKNIDIIQAQNKRVTMGQMHKVNKAMRKSMMRHSHK